MMKSIKRIEIITSSVELNTVLATLRRLEISGYSIIRGVSGSGDRGITTCDLDVDGVCNDYVLALCEAAQEDALMTAIQPILDRYGGVCISTDATCLIHRGRL